MIGPFNINGRYALYALAVLAVVAAYVWLGDDSSNAPAAGARRLSQNEDLPQLTFLDAAGGGEARRNLFAFGKPPAIEKAPPPPPPPPAPVQQVIAPPAAPPPRPDLLAQLKVMGLVRQDDSVTVLLKLGDTLRTVALHERFGLDDALSVQSVQGRKVMIVDNISHASKTFILSED